MNCRRSSAKKLFPWANVDRWVWICPHLSKTLLKVAWLSSDIFYALYISSRSVRRSECWIQNCWSRTMLPSWKPVSCWRTSYWSACLESPTAFVNRYWVPHLVNPAAINAFCFLYANSCCRRRNWYCFVAFRKVLTIVVAFYQTALMLGTSVRRSLIRSCRPCESQGTISICFISERAASRTQTFWFVRQVSVMQDTNFHSAPFDISFTITTISSIIFATLYVLSCILTVFQ
jgi:hypothetical protein